MRYYDQSIDDATKQLLFDLLVVMLLVTWAIWLPMLKGAERLYTWRINAREESP